MVSSRCAREFEEKHNDSLVVKQYVWKVSTVAQLSLSVVADLVAQYYNEDLIHVLYFGSYDKEGSCFKFTIGNKVYEFTNELRKSLF